MITVMTTTTRPPQATQEQGGCRQEQIEAAATGADDDVSSFPHENSRNKNYDNHNFFSSSVRERNGGEGEDEGSGSVSADLCFVSHWTKETLRRVGQGIFGPNWRLVFVWPSLYFY